MPGLDYHIGTRGHIDRLDIRVNGVNARLVGVEERLRTIETEMARQHNAARERLYERMHSLIANISATTSADAMELMKLEAKSILRAIEHTYEERRI